VAFVVAGAAIAAIGLWRKSLPIVGATSDAANSRSPAVSAPASASLSSTSTSVSEAPAEPSVVDALRSTSSPNPRYAEPDEIETRLAQFLASQSGLEVVSLSPIDCDATICEIALTGTEVNPRYVDAYHDLLHRLFAAGWDDFRIRSGGLSTREIAPGAREYVISFEYQPLVDLSGDPLIAARQYAACAAAWRRATENPTPDDIVQGYLQEAERNIALAASVLGLEEATRIAETRGGPVIRTCF
jgi:hypothetical protein